MDIRNKKDLYEKKSLCPPVMLQQFSIQNLLIFAIFKSSLNLNLIRHWSENWCPGYLSHALSSSEIHLAAAKSLEIIGHVTNCCKRPILFPYLELSFICDCYITGEILILTLFRTQYHMSMVSNEFGISVPLAERLQKCTENSQEVFLTSTQAVTALQCDPERLLLLSLRFGVTNTKGRA